MPLPTDPAELEAFFLRVARHTVTYWEHLEENTRVLQKALGLSDEWRADFIQQKKEQLGGEEGYAAAKEFLALRQEGSSE